MSGIYHLQLLYDDKSEQNDYYGREFARRKKASEILSPEVVFRLKNEVLTGGKGWFGRKEKIPGINLILKEVEPTPIQNFLAEQEQKYAYLKPVTRATVALTATSEIEADIIAYERELQAHCKNAEASTVFNQHTREYTNTNIDYLLNASMSSDVSSAIYLYEFAATRGMKHKALAITFY
jgi:hypothetical protein